MERKILSDTELEDIWRKGDSLAFDLLYERYKEPLMNFIYRFLGDFAQAQDIFQETFFRVYQTASRKERPNAEFSTWVYQIARNLCYNEIKKRKRHPIFSINEPLIKGGELEKQDLLIDQTTEQLHSLEKEKMRNDIREAINKLPEVQREVIIMSAYHNFHYEKIAAILKCSVGTVKSRMYYARQLLKKLLIIFK